MKQLLFYLFFCVSSLGWSQVLEPIAIRLSENGMEQKGDTLVSGVETVGAAPMKIMFKANIENVPDGETYHCIWTFSEDPNFNTSLITRAEDNTEYTFDRSGTYFVRLSVSYQKVADNTSREEIADAYIIKISESELKVPNAFSPNGDGINDVFKVKYKSLVKFNAYIFNRWGQELYHWGLPQIEDGWDGTSHGKQVKDGVYFIVVEAIGSDGIKYNHKGDINILRGFSGNGTVPQQ
ncbi:MAG: gliding motility-associated C-terminal domain-containing protein [Bacteroides sp.]